MTEPRFIQYSVTTPFVTCDELIEVARNVQRFDVWADFDGTPTPSGRTISTMRTARAIESTMVELREEQHVDDNAARLVESARVERVAFDAKVAEREASFDWLRAL